MKREKLEMLVKWVPLALLVPEVHKDHQELMVHKAHLVE